jgi:hypothetical protein
MPKVKIIKRPSKFLYKKMRGTCAICGCEVEVNNNGRNKNVKCPTCDETIELLIHLGKDE